MVIIGLNAFHGDASAALFKDGRVVAAVEEERLVRLKHWAGLPLGAIQYCMDVGGIDISDVDYIAINRDPRRNFLKKVKHAFGNFRLIGHHLNRLVNAGEVFDLKRTISEHFGPERGELKLQIYHCEHHLAHLNSAYFPSGFERAWVLSIDGFGDFSSSRAGIFHGNDISYDSSIEFPHSLGIFYSAITQFLGFPEYGDEYKVMGLSSYGKPLFKEEMLELVRLFDSGKFELNLQYFRHASDTVPMEWQDCSPSVGRLWSDELRMLLGRERFKGEAVEQRHMDLAASAQDMYEKAIFNRLNALYEKQALDSLCLAGGCAMNSVANGKITTRTKFKEIYIPSAPGDAGGAIGAVYEVARKFYPVVDLMRDHGPYLGPEFSLDEIESTLSEYKPQIEIKNISINLYENTDKLIDFVSDEIIKGGVVGWFQGRCEWGPRALGNRSILADPRRADMKDILNLKIKRRESFRPFAPSILREHVPGWFVRDADVPYMLEVIDILPNKRAAIPAVTHTNGSGRLQTVVRENNPIYYDLIYKFYQKTSVPILLNTSFNENEPIVCHPREAIECFLRTNMDHLVLEKFVLSRVNRC